MACNRTHSAGPQCLFCDFAGRKYIVHVHDNAICMYAVTAYCRLVRADYFAFDFPLR